MTEDIPEQLENIRAELASNRELLIRGGGPSLRDILVAAIVVVAVMVLGAVAFVTVYLNPILDRTDCNSKANGKTWQAIAATFDTPPSPDSARQQAVHDIKDAAALFDDCR